jgi:hypothetical protein
MTAEYSNYVLNTRSKRVAAWLIILISTVGATIAVLLWASSSFETAACLALIGTTASFATYLLMGNIVYERRYKIAVTAVAVALVTVFAVGYVTFA